MCHREGSDFILDGWLRATFTHTSALTETVATVLKSDDPMSVADSYVVKIAYPEGEQADQDQTRLEILIAAWEAVNAALDGEAVGLNKIA